MFLPKERNAITLQLYFSRVDAFHETFQYTLLAYWTAESVFYTIILINNEATIGCHV